MQKLTTRQALAAVLAILEAREPGDDDAVLDDATLHAIAGQMLRYRKHDGKLTDAGRAMLAEAPRTAEQERADVLAWLADLAPPLSDARNLIDDIRADIDVGHHVGAAEAHDGR